MLLERGEPRLPAASLCARSRSALLRGLMSINGPAGTPGGATLSNVGSLIPTLAQSAWGGVMRSISVCTGSESRGADTEFVILLERRLFFFSS